MPKHVVLVTFTELLSFSETIGFGWNQAHDILVSDGIPPMYECNSRDYYIYDFTQPADSEEEPEYDYSENTIKIMKGFFDKHKLTEFTLIND